MAQARNKILLIVGFVLGLILLSILLQDMFDDLRTLLDQYSGEHAVLGSLIFMALAALSVLLGPFTSAPLTPIAVGLWGAGTTIVLLLGGWLIGNIGAYMIGYYFGNPIMKNVVSAKKFNRWMEFLEQHTDMLFLFLFRLATPSETGYVFGILRYKVWKYFLITFLAELPFAFFIVYAGAAFINKGWVALICLGVAWILLVLFSLRFLNRRVRAHRDVVHVPVSHQ
jgi:uncharacterized membrane protein YdjX (TVP38/TMEM64 family)